MIVGLFWTENEKGLMLVREGRFSDLQVVGYPRESIDADAGAQPLESMCMVGLDLELFDQLAALSELRN